MAQNEEVYRRFAITWQEPPLTGAGYEMSVAPTDDETQVMLQRATSSHGSRPLPGQVTRDAGIAAAKRFIDGLYS
jgi:hypothetical protein